MADRPLSPSARRVQETLERLGFPHLTVVEHAQSARSAAEAASTIGCEVGQIAKSLIFRTKDSGRPVLVIASGPNRVNEKALAERLADRTGGEAIVRADADFVRAATGFAIGGIPPVGHANPAITLIDRDLLRYDVIWAAAGTPNAVFRLTSDELERMTGGKVEDVT